MSVTIIGYQKKKNQEGGSFLVLNIEGGVVMSQSESTGSWFASTMKTSIVASMDEKTIMGMIGQTLPGTIIKKQCPPYSYTIPSTGEDKTLDYTYEFCPED